MATLTTTRLGLPSPDGDEPVAVPDDIRALALAIDGAAVVDAGPDSNRPESSPSVPGLAGRWYWSTDTEQLAFDHGTGWLTVWPQAPGAASITDTHLANDAVITRTIADNAVTAAKIAAGAVGTTQLAAGAVTSAKIASALKPSAGAGASTEALRALGTQAGRAAAGTHASQHASSGADPLYRTGTASGTTGGTGVWSATITHSLGVVPSFVGASIVSGQTASTVVAQITSKTSTQATITILTAVAGHALTIEWVALR